MLNLTLLEHKLHALNEIIWGWPVVIFIALAGLIFSMAFNWIQIRYFITGWKLLFTPETDKQNNAQSISPFQAFINALSASLGNGGLAGMATVLVAGGPGTMFWIFILGFISMILRFTEVYAGTLSKNPITNERGPLAYIQKLPLGHFFVYLYAIIMLVYIFVGGNAMQCNSMGLALQRVTGWSFYTVASLFAGIVLYITYGGAQRIMKASQAIIPVKVCLFFFTVISVIATHASQIPAALKLILAHALQWQSLTTGVIAFTIQQAMSVGFARALNATEAGVGTAAIFFGSTETKKPFKTAVMSIITAFIATNLVCSMLILSLVVTGVWDNGMTSTQLVIAAFSTTFGAWAGPLVTFLSFSFGLGVLVAYSFLGSKMWTFLFGKASFLYTLLFAAAAFFGTLSSVGFIWDAVDMIVALLIAINVSALLWILPDLRESFVRDEKEYKATQKHSIKTPSPLL